MKQRVRFINKSKIFQINIVILYYGSFFFFDNYFSLTSFLFFNWFKRSKLTYFCHKLWCLTLNMTFDRGFAKSKTLNISYQDYKFRDFLLFYKNSTFSIVSDCSLFVFLDSAFVFVSSVL